MVRSVFLNEQQARVALDRLRAAFQDDRIEMRLFRNIKTSPGDYLGDYDPLGGARLAGVTLATMPATGANLVGNSTTIDLSLGELDDILAMVAEDERRGGGRKAPTRIVATVTVHTEAEAEAARRIMLDSGGRDLTLDRKDVATTPEAGPGTDLVTDAATGFNVSAELDQENDEDENGEPEE